MHDLDSDPEFRSPFPGNHISRLHCEFRKVVDAGDGKTYWEVFDASSSTRTYLNRVLLPNNTAMRERCLVIFSVIK